jgi:hypothetical protein
VKTEIRKLVEEMSRLGDSEEDQARLAEIEEILEEYEMGEWIEYDQ